MARRDLRLWIAPLLLALGAAAAPSSAAALEAPLEGGEVAVEAGWGQLGFARVWGARARQTWWGISADWNSLGVTPEVGLGQRLLDGGPGRRALRLNLSGGMPVMFRRPQAVALRAEAALLAEFDNRYLDFMIGPSIEALGVVAGPPEAAWTPQLLLAMGWDIGGIRTTAHVGAGYTYSPPGRGSLTGQLGFVITVPTMW